VQRAQMIHGPEKHRYFRDEHAGAHRRTKILCLIDNSEFGQTPDEHVKGKTGCTCCPRISKAEGTILDWLEMQSLDFEYQKRFAPCHDKAVLPFDFYLADRRLLIEYDGEHHYHEYHTPLRDMQRRDSIKTEWARRNGYHLLRILYWDKDKIPSIPSVVCLGEQS